MKKTNKLLRLLLKELRARRLATGLCLLITQLVGKCIITDREGIRCF